MVHNQSNNLWSQKLWFVVISKEKREDGKSKNEGKRQSLLGGSGNKVVDGQQKKGEEDESSSMEDYLSPIGARGVSIAREDIQSGTLASTPVPKPVVRCKFHDGTVKYKVWSCCRKHVSSDPCQAAEFHLARTYPQGQLERLWKFHPTPSAYTSHQIRPVVAIDCEMGTAKSGDSELIRVTLIDYFSSEILVDKLVYPDVAMEHYNTRFSGVTRKEMENALIPGQCLMGKSKAREAVWRFVGPHTIVVGHSANNDLTAMRWIHTVVVDTFMVESKKKKAKEEKAKEEKANEEKAKTVAKRDGKEREVREAEQHKEKPKKVKGSGALSLKTLTRERLKREIQTAGRGHDSLEDVIATRDLAHWNVLKALSDREGPREGQEYRAIAMQLREIFYTTRNGPSVVPIHDVPLNSPVLVWREGNAGHGGKWTGPFPLLGIHRETCRIQLPSGPTDFRSTVVKPYYVNNKEEEEEENESETDSKTEKPNESDDTPTDQTVEPPRRNPERPRRLPTKFRQNHANISVFLGYYHTNSRAVPRNPKENC